MKLGHSKTSVLNIVIKKTFEDTKLKNKLLDELSTKITKDRVSDILQGSVAPSKVTLAETVALYVGLYKLDNTIQHPSTYFFDEELTETKSYFKDNKDSKRAEAAAKITQKIQYNPDRKIKYIEEITKDKSDKFYRQIVNKFLGKYNKFEIKFGKDIAEFTLSEYQGLFKNITANSFQFAKSELANYLSWCVDNAYISEDRYDDYKNNLLFEEINTDEVYKNKYFFSLDELISTVDRTSEKMHRIEGTQNLTDEKIMGIVIPSIYLCWLGFDTGEISALRKMDVDIKNKRILTKTKDIKEIDDRIVQSLEPCVMGNPTDFLLEYGENSDTIVNKKRYIELQIALFNNYVKSLGEKSIQHKKVKESGVFYRLLMLERKMGRRIANVRNRQMIGEILYKPDVSYAVYLNIVKGYEEWKKFVDKK